MTATQLFMAFLKKKCTLDEYLFFRNTIMYDNGNKYFKNRRLYKNTFVEDYLSRNNRALNNFMTRMFILAPNLVNNLHRNPRYNIIKTKWVCEHGGKKYTKVIRSLKGNVLYTRDGITSWNNIKGRGMYVEYYRRLWNKFLREEVDESSKKFNSPFKKGEIYCFNFKEYGKDTCV